jgi:hypothetical protein
MPEAKNRELTIIVTVAIAAAFAVIDYLAPDAMRGPHPGSEWLGLCAAQVTLIAAWAVFAPGNIVTRLPWTILFGLMMLYTIVFGYRSSDRAHSQRPEDVVVLGEVLLLSVIVLQIPLWIAKRAFRYRMVVTGEDPTPIAEERLQFQVKHLLIGTFILAVALSPIRYILPNEHVSLTPRPDMLVLVPMVIVTNLVATLPCLWGGFTSLPGLLFVLAWAVYCLIVTGIELGVISAIDGGRAGADRGAFAILYALNGVQAAVVFGVMRIYRALGYRLQRVPRYAPSPEEMTLEQEADTPTVQDPADAD